MVVITWKDRLSLPLSPYACPAMGLLSPICCDVTSHEDFDHWACLSLLNGSCWKKKESKVYVDGHRKYRVRLAPEKL